MEKLSTEGIVVNVLPFQEFDRIVTLFTPHHGLIKLFVKGAFSKKNGHGNTTDPLSEIEVQCTRKSGDLYKCYEASQIHSNHLLRQNLPTLQSACDMLQTISATQLPEKSVPELYLLITTYLKMLPQAKHPEAVAASFRLKTLRYEGLLDLREKIDEIFSIEDIKVIIPLTYSLNFSQIAEIAVDQTLAEKIKAHFEVLNR